MRLPLPFGGLSNLAERGDQPPGTSSDLLNVLPFDARTGRAAIAQRPGDTKYCSTQIGSGKVKAIAPIPTDAQLLTYTSLGSTVTTEWSQATRTIGDAKGVRCDRQGNAFFLDGKAALYMVNPAGVIVAKLAFPVADPLHEVRALHIDRADLIFAGVSTGGAQATARMWCYKVAEGNTFTLVWQREPGEYCEAIDTANDALYYAANRTDSNTSRIVCLTGYDVDSPTERTVRNAPYPLNDLDVSPKDGAIFVASEPNTTRGYNPLSPETTAISEDWTPKNNLESYQRRAWSLYDTRDPNGMLIIPPTGTDDIEGGECTILYDLSGNNRHFYAATDVSHTGPRYRAQSIAGLPGLHFNGSTNSMVTLAPTSNDKASRGEQLTALPVYAGAQFVMVMVVRLAVSASGHIVLAQDTGGGATRAIVANTIPGGAIAGANSDNSVRLFELNGIAPATGAGTTDPASESAPAGNNTTPLPGCIGPGGLCILTWICDGGVHDVWTSATRSVWRVNGLPCDRWQSAAFTSTVGTRLGHSTVGAVAKAAMDFSYMIVLADWYDTSDTRQRLVLDNNSTQPLDTRYPDINFSFSSTVTNDIQELEGAVAHAHGLGHLLPGGQAVWLVDRDGGSLDNGNTITIDGVTYTARAAGGLAAANDFVGVGVSLEVALRNLRRAINGEGSPGTDYFGSTIPHTNVRAQGPTAYQSTNRCGILLRTINPHAAAFSVSKTEAATQTLGWVNSALTAAATVTTSTTSEPAFPRLGGTPPYALSKNTNWYPHQYLLERIASGNGQTLGGPPRSEDALTAPSKPSLFVTAKTGLVAKIDPANGKVKWVATSNYDNGGLGLGGLGYGVKVSASGYVYSCGPRQPAVTTPSITAEDVDIRKLIDAGTSFTSTSGIGAAAPWTHRLATALTYKYPRMDVDPFDNVYVPIHLSATGQSLMVFSPVGITVVNDDGATILADVTNIDLDPRGYAVAIHPTIPDYPVAFTDDRAQYVYLGAEKTSANVAALKLGLVSVVNTSGSPRTIARLAVVGTDIKTFTSGGTVTTVGSGVLDTAAQLVTPVVGFQKVFFFDGRKPYYYDAKAGTVSALVAEGGGELPPEIRHACIWRNRLFVASGRTYASSGIGKPFDWNFFPAVPNDAMAVSAPFTTSGNPSDSIQSFHPIGNDLLIFGGVQSIRALAGNPARPNTQLQVITDKVGTAYGSQVWARDDAGISYFFGSDANVYALVGLDVAPISGAIHEVLRTIDFSTYTVRLVFDTRWQVLHVLVVPLGAGGTVVTNYRWHKPTKSWWPAQKAAAGQQYTCAAALEGDTAADRLILFGCEDGYVRKEDPAARTDDTLRMETRCLIGPIVPETEEYEARSTSMQAVLDDAADGCLYQLYAASTPTRPTNPLITGTLRPGRNNVPARMAGSHIWLMLRALSAPISFSITGATWTNGTLTLTKTGAFASYTFVAGDTFTVTSGTGATVGVYPIASRVSDNAITLGVTIGAGADGQTDIAGTVSLKQSGYRYAIESAHLDVTRAGRKRHAPVR